MLSTHLNIEILKTQGDFEYAEGALPTLKNTNRMDMVVCKHLEQSG